MDAWVEVHGGLRWLVAVTVVGALIMMFIAWQSKRWFRLLGWTLTALAVLLTLQLGLGVFLLIRESIAAEWDFRALRLQYEHAITMLIAVGLSHILPRMSQRYELLKRLRNVSLILVCIALLVAVGVIRIRGVGYWIP